MKPARVISLVIGSFLALVGFGLLAGGGALGWAQATQRDDAGFFTTSTERFATDSFALTSAPVDLGDPGPNAFGEWANGVVRVRVDGVGSGEVFVGIARDADVEAYLTDIPHDSVITSERFGRSLEVTYTRENESGTGSPTQPSAQSFWVASSSSVGAHEIVWQVKGGSWAIVVMNADGTANVTADVQLGGKVDHLVGIAVGLGVGGIVLLAGGAVPSAVQADASSPLRIEAHLDAGLSRWQWLVKWFLAIPHVVVLALLWVAFSVLTVVAFFAILFTGRYPRSIFDFNVGVLRWTWRVSYYATSGLGTDRYPPFTLEAADYPATLDVAYPEHLSRGLVLVKSWLLALPHLVIVAVLTASWSFGDRDGAELVFSGGLLGLLVLVAGVMLLFTGRYPERLHDLVVGVNRWVYRVVVYVALMTDQYPPFHLDQGPDEPAAPAAPAAPLTATSPG